MARSFFSERQRRIDSRLCFVVMPFDDALSVIYDIVEDIVQDYCGLKCLRADKIYRSGRITEDIWRNISEARLLIADLSELNPNVFYEIGIAHALSKSVILMAQNVAEVPFDLKEMRCINYSPSSSPRILKQDLVKYIRTCISTMPEAFDVPFSTSLQGDPYFSASSPSVSGPCIKLTSLQSPSSIVLGQPFEISLKATNVGAAAKQGYFSVSFPDGVDRLQIVGTSTATRIGLGGDSWGNGRVVLNYPIAEGYTYDSEKLTWPSWKEHYIKIQGIAKHRGFLWFYISASCYDETNNRWVFDPVQPLLDIDQRGEYVYCGVIEVN